MQFFIRLPRTKQVSLVSLITSSNGDENLLGELVSLTHKREEMRNMLNEQEKVVDRNMALKMVTVINTYLAKLKDIERYIQTKEGIIQTNSVVFIWKSSFVENSKPILSAVYNRNSTREKEHVLSTATGQPSNFSFGATQERAESPLHTVRSAVKSINIKKRSFRRNSSEKPVEDGKDRQKHKENDTQNSNKTSITQKTSLVGRKSGFLENLVSPFNSRSYQSTSIEFEMANVLHALAVSKMLLAYLQVDSFDLVKSEEISELILPKSSSPSLMEKSSISLENKKGFISKVKKGLGAGKDKVKGKVLEESSIEDSQSVLPGSSELSEHEYANMAIKGLREAAGIFQYIRLEFSPRMKLLAANSPDLDSMAQLMFETLAIADADRLIACRAARENYKLSIISRTLLYAVEQYRAVLEIVNTLRIDDKQFISSEFKDYVRDTHKLIYSISLVYLAKISYSSKNCGFAVGYIREAREMLKALEKDNANPTHSLSASSVLTTSVNHLYQLYTGINDTVYFDQIPSKKELISKIPSGRPFSGAISYTVGSNRIALF